ncbi:MAG: TlpA family protein disulfide reductase [Bacteroidetes bacterium]|nr:TlpA family protein disulfide reductase [Bacteroidota bacterium]
MKKAVLVFLFAFLISAVSKAQMYTDFTITDMDGNDVTLSKVLDNSKGVMIGFWATWCSPCKEEMKRLADVYGKYKDQGFEYIAISIDNQKSTAKVKSFITAQGYTFKVCLDPEKRVFESYGGKDEVPYSIMVNKNKEVVSVHVGFKTGDELKIEEEIKSMLGIK